MAEYTLITDSTCDLNEEMYKEMDVSVIRMVYTINEVDHIDDGSQNSHEFYDMIAGGAAATTMQINVQTYIDAFSEELSKGRDVLYIGFSLALSGSFRNSQIAAEECREKFPERKVIVIDSKSQCGGEGLLVYHAAALRRDGMGIDELARWTENAIESHCHYFTVNDLNHLYRGGRLSRGAAVMGTLVGIKPAMYTNSDGVLCVGAKVRGRVHAVKMMADKVVEKAIDPSSQLIIINHADCLEDAKLLAEDVENRVHPKEIKILDLGPVIGAHVGPGCLAIFFVGDNRNW